MFHSLIFFLVFFFAFIPFVQEPFVLQRQGSMFFVLETIEVPQCSFQRWKGSGTIFFFSVRKVVPDVHPGLLTFEDVAAPAVNGAILAALFVHTSG